MEVVNTVVSPLSDHSAVEPFSSTLDTSPRHETSVCCSVIHPGDKHRTGSSHCPSPRSGHYMEYSPFLKKVVLYGGLGFSYDAEYFNDLWVVDPVTDLWQRLCNPTSEVADTCPVGTFGHAACLLEDGKKLFIHGGINWDGATCEAWIYDFETSEWIEFIDEDGPLHEQNRWGHSATLIRSSIGGEDKILLFGGDIDCRNVVENFEHERGTSSDHLFVINTRTWHPRLISRGSSQEWPAGRRRHGAVVYRDVFLLIFGGRDLDDVFYDDLWVINTLTFKWIQIGPSLPPRLLSFFYDNPNDCQYTDRIRELTAEGKGTEEEQHRDGIGKTTLPRTGLSLLCANDTLYITGGFLSRETNFYDFVGFACYSLTQNRWYVPENVGSYPNSVTMSAACLIPKVRPSDAVECYLHGGRTKDTPVNSFYAIKLPERLISLKELCFRWFFSNERRYNLEHVKRRDKIVKEIEKATPPTIRPMLRSEALLKYTNGSE